MTDSETVALILLWGRIAPNEPNAWDWRCEEQAWMSKHTGWCEEDTEYELSVEQELETEDTKYQQQWGE